MKLSLNKWSDRGGDQDRERRSDRLKINDSRIFRASLRFRREVTGSFGSSSPDGVFMSGFPSLNQARWKDSSAAANTALGVG